MKTTKNLLALALLLGLSSTISAHSGGLDARGGHNSKSGYHFHRSSTYVAPPTVYRNIEERISSPPTQARTTYRSRVRVEPKRSARTEYELLESVNPESVSTEKQMEIAAERESEFRTWNTADGKYSVEARMASFRGDLVTLEKHDGSMIEVKLERLSNEDEAYIEQVKKTGKR